MKRRLDFDILRVFACLAVVYLHVAAPALRLPVDANSWQVSNLLSALATAAVPVFFMISGALALGSSKTEEVGDLLRRRIWRVCVPLVVWTAMMLGYYLWRDGADAAWGALKNVLHQPVTTPYWFLYAYLSLLLLSPLFKKLADGLERRHWKYLLGLWFCFTILAHTVRAVLPAGVSEHLHWYAPYSLHLLGGMAGYYFLGYYLTKYPFRIKKRYLLSAIVGLVLVIAWATYVDSVRNGMYSESFKSYLSLPVALLASALFLLAHAMCGQKKSGKVLGYVANVSFGVYLSHPLLMDVLRRAVSGETLISIEFFPAQVSFFLAVSSAAVLLSLVLGALPGVRFLFLGNRKKKG